MAGKLRDFLSDTAIYGLASVFSRVFGFLLIPLYINHLGSAQYANIILLQLLFGVFTIFFGLTSGVFYYYYEYPKPKYERIVFSSWLYYQLIVLAGVLIMAYFTFPFFRSFFDLSELGIEGNMMKSESKVLLQAFAYMILQLIPYVIYNTYYNLCRIRLKPGKVVLITVSEAVLILMFVCYFVFFKDMSIDGVMLGQLLGRSILSGVILLSGFYKFFDVTQASIKLLKRIVTFTWPFFLVNAFFWFMNSVDKFIGTNLLDSQTEVGYLALGMQVVLPISILVQVTHQALGPYIMSIRKLKDSKENYVAVFSFVLFMGILASSALIGLSPILIKILANEQFFNSLVIIPLFALAAVINLSISQFGIGCNLNKKNIYIAIGIMTGGILGFILNIILQPIMGIAGAGFSQIISYCVSAAIIYRFSNRFMPIDYEFGWVSILLLIFVIEIILSEAMIGLTGWSLYAGYLALGSISSVIILLLGNIKYNFIGMLKSKLT